MKKFFKQLLRSMLLLVVVAIGAFMVFCHIIYSPQTYTDAIEDAGVENIRKEARLLIEDYRKKHDEKRAHPMDALPEAQIPPGIASIPHVARVTVQPDGVVLRVPGPDYIVVRIQAEDRPRKSGYAEKNQVTELYPGIYFEDWGAP